MLSPSCNLNNYETEVTDTRVPSVGLESGQVAGYRDRFFGAFLAS
jgi:hypothetical protein